jgi:competence protein ComEA
MWRRVTEWLALTSVERKVILFLAGAFLIGSGLRLYSAMYPERAAHDYRESDSTFAALSQRPVETSKQTPSFAVNINTATKEELMALPGVGEVMAERIMLYRQDVGPFTSINDLMKVKGIGHKRLEQLKPHITVEPTTREE